MLIILSFLCGQNNNIRLKNFKLEVVYIRQPLKLYLNMRLLFTLTFSIIFSLSLFSQTVNKISLHRESQALIKGQKIIEHADCFYSSESLDLIVHVIKPREYIKIISNKGELKMFFPKENMLMLKQNSYLATNKEDLYIYINNMYDDLGLRAEGFTIQETRYEGEYMIVEWAPPAQDKTLLLKVEIIYENMMPIYTAAYNIKGDLFKKTYYSDYFINNNLVIPKRITDITYTTKTDSIIRRTLYSDLKINEQADISYENYKIPKDAKLIK